MISEIPLAMEDRRSGGVSHESGGPGGARIIGPKVSQIANIFQSKVGNAPNATAAVVVAAAVATTNAAGGGGSSVNSETVHASHGGKTRGSVGRDTSVSPKHDQREQTPQQQHQHHFSRDRDSSKGSNADSVPSQITVVRTESHVARFNSAKALFEKLGTSE
jgi:hypothetical protein